MYNKLLLTKKGHTAKKYNDGFFLGGGGGVGGRYSI